MNIQANVAAFSIVEFLIALTLGALVVAGTSSVYISNKSNYRVQEALARLQENVRYANFILTRELRMAGYQGCASGTFITINNIVRNSSNPSDYTYPIKGYTASGSTFNPSLPTNLLNKSVANSDILEVRMGTHVNVQLSSDMNVATSALTVYSRSELTAGDIALITNCTVGDIFVAEGATSTSIAHSAVGNTSAAFSSAYTLGTDVLKYTYEAFYVKNTGRTNTQNQPIYALISQDVNGNENEIAEGIEQMRVTYGVDTNIDKAVDTYQTATEVNNANNWGNVVSVRIQLLFATTENVASKSQPYTFNGATTTPSDRKLRRVWSDFITLRNRGMPS